jgi:hypothetical protein
MLAQLRIINIGGTHMDPHQIKLKKKNILVKGK